MLATTADRELAPLGGLGVLVAVDMAGGRVLGTFQHWLCAPPWCCSECPSRVQVPVQSQGWESPVSAAESTEHCQAGDSLLLQGQQPSPPSLLLQLASAPGAGCAGLLSSQLLAHRRGWTIATQLLVVPMPLPPASSSALCGCCKERTRCAHAVCHVCAGSPVCPAPPGVPPAQAGL